jgi:hypothetical protein
VAPTMGTPALRATPWMVWARASDAERRREAHARMRTGGSMPTGGLLTQGTQFILGHLEQLRADSTSGAVYDVCDDITSGYMQGFCADKDARFDNARMARDLSALTAGWSPTERAAFTDKAVFESFVTIRSDKEVDQRGTGRAAFMIEEEQSLRRDLLASLHAFEADSRPAYTADDFRRADSALNAVYARSSPVGTVTRDGIRQTERVWLTRQRVVMLRDFLPGS